MKRRWRLKVHGPMCYNHWCNFDLTLEHRQILTDLRAIIYPLAEVIVFPSVEDVLVFRLKAGIQDDFE